MSVILALDTSTEACSCALSLDGERQERFEIVPRQHARRLLPMIKGLMDEAGLGFHRLDAIAYGRGPGSFTGLRIAAGVTQGIALGVDIPVIPVSSLASLAMQFTMHEAIDAVFACLDARIDEVYWGCYSVETGAVSLMGVEGLCKPESLERHLLAGHLRWLAAGSGLQYLDRMPDAYRETLSVLYKDTFPRAGTIAELAEEYLRKGLVQRADDVSPVYLRDNVARKSV